MRISEKEAKKLLELPLGLVFEDKGNFELENGNISFKPLRVKEVEIGDIHSKASHYKVESGKLTELWLKI